MNYLVIINTQKQFRVEADSPEAAKEAAKSATPVSANETVNVRESRVANQPAAPSKPNA